ncbi:Outer membrane usher protein papC precursor [Cedecea davisae]|nr:Outer membrane usher protein papC precursor [Cedecea davisae]
MSFFRRTPLLVETYMSELPLSAKRNRLRPLVLNILLALSLGQLGLPAHAVEPIQFNTEVLDLKDRSQIDLSQFSQAGYVMPGTYSLALQINTSSLPEQAVRFLVPDDDANGSLACLTPEIVPILNLRHDAEGQLTWWHHNECLNPASLPGMTIEGDMGAGVLHVNIPQAYQEYTAENWDPPARWDEGVAGLLFDYSLNGQDIKQQGESGSESRSLSGNGVAGANFGPWRLRADWQAEYNHGSGDGGVERNWTWNRYYMYRAIKALRAQLMLGENYLNSGMFDSFRYTGASLVSDDGMLPPNLRGYAPEVTGVAKTNARVTISQSGRVIYETTVAAGPFRIQDLNNTVSGKLDVKIQESDGSVQTFELDTATIPYLTRPGVIRYKFASGKPSNYGHHGQGQGFATGEFSMGISNGWSAFGGLLAAGDYNALAVGIGRDLLEFGAMSFDITQSRAKYPNGNTLQGGSYRLSYSKRFDATDSQVTFAGYRFSERNFRSMSQYLNERYQNSYSGGNSKEFYTLNFNQQIRALNMTAYLNYGHQTYWDRSPSDTYTLSVSRYFDFWKFKNASVNFSAFRTKKDGINDDGMYVSISVPWGESGSLSYDTQAERGGGSSHNLGYSDRIGERDNYRISAGVGQDKSKRVSGYLSHQASLAEINASASYERNNYTSLAVSMKGGVTGTANGVALHRSGMPGGTRMMVDTGGASNVPVRGVGSSTYTNMFGKAVVSDVSSYYRNSLNVDLNELGNNVEATRSVVEGTLTEGAIGYRKFGIIEGQKGMAVIRLVDGSSPPFGSVVMNANSDQTGMVSEEGNVWLSGMNPDERMVVKWNGADQCGFTLPSAIPEGSLLLPCLPVIHKS